MEISGLTFSIVAAAAGALAIAIAIVDQRREPEPGHGWFVAALVAFLAAAIPFHPFGFAYDTADNAYPWRFAAVLVVLLPVLLLHVVAVVCGTRRTRSIVANDVFALALAAWILAMPTLPGTDYRPQPWWYQVGIGGFGAQFVVSVGLSVRMLRHATRFGVGPARTRANLLAGALITFATGYLIWFVWPDPTIELVSSIVAFAAAVLLWLAVRAPRRMYSLLPWIDPSGPGSAIEHLIGHSDVVAALPHTLDVIVESWGLIGAAVLDGDEVIAAVGSSPLGSDAARSERAIRIAAASGSIVVLGWTVPFTPPLRRADRDQLRLLASLIQLSFDREAAATVERRALAETAAAARSLEVAARRLSEADASRDRFINVVANELRGPVATMLGLTRRSETQWSELPADQLAPLQGLLARQSERVAGVVEQLLLVSSIEDGTLRSARTSTDARVLLQAVAREAGLDHAESTSCTDDDACCTVDLEPVGVRRILSILVDNARRHGAEPVQLRSRREPQHVALDVVDHGPGVDPSFLSAMFERFTRNATPGEPGVGLGLAIAHELASSLDAHLGYRRDAGRTVFTLRLPRR